jgi:hypothetical protein
MEPIWFTAVLAHQPAPAIRAQARVKAKFEPFELNTVIAAIFIVFLSGVNVSEREFGGSTFVAKGYSYFAGAEMVLRRCRFLREEWASKRGEVIAKAGGVESVDVENGNDG